MSDLAAAWPWEFVCTCTSAHPENHPTICHLWEDSGFAKGENVWDEGSQKLVPYEDFYDVRGDPAWDHKSEAKTDTDDDDNDDELTADEIEKWILDDAWDGACVVTVLMYMVGALILLENEKTVGDYSDWLYALGVEEGEKYWSEELEDLRSQEEKDKKKVVELHPGKKDGDPADPCKCKPQAWKFCMKCQVMKRTDGKWVVDTDWDFYGGTFYKCRHYFTPVTYPDGTTIYASSLLTPTDRKADQYPDFGIYFASSWQPVTLAYFLNWPDFNLPKLPWTHVEEAVDEAISRFKQGQRVEVGCIGGHGRTGTFLALVATKCGVPADEAVEWVRKNYCHEAVEGRDQAWYVEFFDAMVKGEEPPEKPAPVVTVTATTKQTEPKKEIVPTSPPFKAPYAPSQPASSGLVSEIVAFLKGPKKVEDEEKVSIVKNESPQSEAEWLPTADGKGFVRKNSMLGQSQQRYLPWF